MSNTPIPSSIPTSQEVSLESPSSSVDQATDAKPVIAQSQNIFIEPAPGPTMMGANGIRYDFNFGCRVELPPLLNGKKWRVRYTDMVTFNVIFEAESEGGGLSKCEDLFCTIQD